MSVAPTKTIGIKGCAVWLADERGSAIGTNPQIDNTTITAPSIEFGTTDVNIMGTLSVPDFTKLDNFSLSVNIPVDNPEAMRLCQLGLTQWIISYCVASIDARTGLESVVGYRIYARGYVTSVPSADIAVGNDTTADVTMNLVSYKKWALGADVPAFDIDRLSGKVEINGVNYSRAVDELF